MKFNHVTGLGNIYRGGYAQAHSQWFGSLFYKPVHDRRCPQLLIIGVTYFESQA